MSTSRNSVAAYHALKRSIERQISISRFSHIFYRRDGVLYPFRRVYRRMWYRIIVAHPEGALVSSQYRRWWYPLPGRDPYDTSRGKDGL